MLFNKAVRIRLFGLDPQGEIIIPEMVDGELVTRISAGAFEGCSGLNGIIIPNSVTRIGREAFRGCTGLTGITIADSVTHIEYRAFYGCSGATIIIIPNSLTMIGAGAFGGCTRLSGIIIPISVTIIGAGAFQSCSGLTGIIIPNSVTFIDGDWAFAGCPELNNDNIKFSVPARSLLSYKWETNNSKLFSVLDYLFEFFSWQEVAQMTKVSKGFYSNIIVRSRQFFLHHMLGDSTIITKTDVTISPGLLITGARYKDCLLLNRSDELALYSSDCSEITSVTLPSSFEDPPPAEVE